MRVGIPFFHIADALGNLKQLSLFELSLGTAIGAITFSGSVIAFSKLNGNMSGAPITFKGQHWINFTALRTVLRAKGKLGFNCKILMEMGEERGSYGLGAFCEIHKERLAADVLIASDGPRLNSATPTVMLGSRDATYAHEHTGVNRALNSKHLNAKAGKELFDLGMGIGKVVMQVRRVHLVLELI